MKVCVDCQKDVSGMRAVKIKEDRIIDFIRKVKRALKISRENELYVCYTCLPIHKEKRKSFEKTMLIFSVVAALILLLMLATTLISGRFELWAIVSGLLIIALLLVFSLIFRYAPAAVETAPVLIPGKPVESKANETAEKKQPEKKPKRRKKKKGGK